MLHTSPSSFKLPKCSDLLRANQEPCGPGVRLASHRVQQAPAKGWAESRDSFLEQMCPSALFSDSTTHQTLSSFL